MVKDVRKVHHTSAMHRRYQRIMAIIVFTVLAEEVHRRTTLHLLLLFPSFLHLQNGAIVRRI